MHDIYTIDLGGGTRIRREEENWKIGPDRVGYQLTEKAIVFGGDDLTATDVAIGADMMQIKNAKPERVKNIPSKEIYPSLVTLVEKAIDRMKTSNEDITVILAGGRSEERRVGKESELR